MPSKEYGDFETALVFESQRNSKLPYRAPTTIIVRSQMYSSDATRNWKKLCSIPSDAKALDVGQLIAAARRRGSEIKISKVDDVGAEKIKTIGDSLRRRRPCFRAPADALTRRRTGIRAACCLVASRRQLMACIIVDIGIVDIGERPSRRWPINLAIRWAKCWLTVGKPKQNHKPPSNG
jgi:hypothetical protein